MATSSVPGRPSGVMSVKSCITAFLVDEDPIHEGGIGLNGVKGGDMIEATIIGNVIKATSTASM